MAVKKTSKEAILKEAVKLFKIRGYHNTSMADIAEACGLIKGSIYHHFKSKDEIGLESLKFIHLFFENHIFSIAYDTTLSDKEKAKHFIKAVDDYFLHSEGGCLLGNLALEISNENLPFKEEIRNYFSAWEKALSHILEKKYGKKEAAAMAKEYVALTQGTIMMMNLYNTPDAYLKVGKKIVDLS